MEPNRGMPDFSMDPESLYREDVYTDNRVGTIRRMTPVTATGADDPSRTVVYVGSTQVMTPAGALPLSFEIEADDLPGAVQGFGAAAEEAVEQTLDELREMQREAAGKIVVPRGGMDPGAMGGGGPMGGGRGGGGGIQMP